MTLYQAGRRLHVAAEAREVYDVSGAGDTVIATLATMLAGGAGIEDAVHVANRAAGIVVGKFGTAVVRPEELFATEE
ncbi:Bifunctional protein HldE [compost metagenome]